MMIVAINGKKGSGKDTVADFMQEIAEKYNDPPFLIKKFAGKLKVIASILTGIKEEKFEDQEFKKSYLPSWDMTAREFLQRLGTEAIRNGLHKDAWVNALMSEYDNTIKEDWIITDLRFENEYEAVLKRGGRLIRIINPRIISTDTHPSETALDNHEFDYTIVNDGSLEQLKEKVKDLYFNLF